eukprot:CAMPEP_0201480548 /NCGR_PEP_ID=MMETSP0151_2-20130828/5018_1 /ASSEMBLY_ACC=CAM_ASM_000257 /TAXON_ID=200890 /ORGANISM="Paramoeba atlantica, Strain 621/1 / CCAP 1560/9" /LENGTH=128 /DNA_ID=CAMNT_0047862441 /DNA_START=99 /DNA_END=482 /DNA_ORIENTATION=-
MAHPSPSSSLSSSPGGRSGSFQVMGGRSSNPSERPSSQLQGKEAARNHFQSKLEMSLAKGPDKAFVLNYQQPKRTSPTTPKREERRIHSKPSKAKSYLGFSSPQKNPSSSSTSTPPSPLTSSHSSGSF